MPQPIKVLIVEGSHTEAELLVQELRKAGFEPDWQRVDTEAEYLGRLQDGINLVLSDYQMPQFSGLRALELLQQGGLEVPFILVSGTGGEDTAVTAMRRGASDYLIKTQLARLGESVSQALEASRLRAERRRIEQRMLLQATALETADDAVIITDAGGIMLWVNPAFTAQSGYTADEAVGQTPRLLKSGKHVPGFYQNLWAALLAGKTWRGGIANRRKDGSFYFVENTITPVKSKAGVITHFVTIMNDVTERRAAEEALRASEAHLKEAQSTARIGSWRHLPDGSQVWSDQMYELFQLPRDVPPTYEAALAVMHPADRAGSYRHALQQALDSGARYFDTEYRVVWPDGRILTLSLLGRINRDSNGQLVDAVGTVQDITDRKRAETLVTGQNKVLELLATGEPLPGVLEALVRFIETQSPDMLCSVLLIDADGTHVRHGAAPSLPEEFNRAIDGLPVGPRAGSCGTAVFRGEAVIVEDIATDPLWEGYRDFALPHGLRACWSTPIFDATRRVLGTFAIYHREPGQPNEGQRRLIEAGTHLASVCLGRHREQQALRASERRLALIYDTVTDALFFLTVGEDGRFRFSDINRAFIAATGLSRDAVVGRYADEIIPPASHELVLGRYAEAIATKKPVHWEETSDYPTGRRSGVVTVVPVFNENGNCTHLVGSVHDVTERKQAEDALRESEQRYRSTLDNILEGCQLIGFDWRYLYLNRAAAVQNRRPNEELLGRKMPEAWPGIEATGVFALLQRCMAERIALHEETEFAFPDGSKGWFDVRSQPVPEGVFVLSVDISERKRAEMQLQASHAQLRALAARLQTVREEQSTHIAREIHDVLGQQLTALKLDLAWLQRRTAAVGDEGLKAALAGKLGTASQLVDTTIQSVQKIATELRPGTLDKLGLAAALEQEARDFAQRAGLRYTCELAAAPLDLDDRTATGIFRIFQEALTNIARHAHATEFRFRLVRDHAGVQLEVGDNGQGITAAQLAEAKSLGLLGMRERANLLGGRLDIQGRSGVGTTVTLTVPLPP